VETYRSTEFEKDQYHMSKAVLSEKYGSHIYQSYKHVHDAIKTNVPLSKHENAYATYQKQLELYGEDGELENKPFGLLKVIYESSEERIPTENTSAIFSFLSDDEYVIVDLTQPDYVEQAERYFSKLTTEKHMEGVVMKPEYTVNNAIPYMKVRNADYLSLVYGYDYQFPHKYDKLIKQKNVRQKLKTSLNEYRLGQRMLAVKLDEITPQHAEYKELVANLLFEVGSEKELDPRL
jgi:PNKP adenylyltransferase domain, ligase domain